MQRREFIAGLGGAAAWPVVARGQQQPSMLRIGFLDSRSSDEVASRLRAFREGLNETGYIEGENLAIVYRWADNHLERLPALAADLVSRRVAVIVTPGVSGALAAKAATTTIPIIFLAAADPLGTGLVTSYARPEGNVTGINFLDSELAAKQLELLHELLPAATRIAVIVNPAEAIRTETTLHDLEPAARTMGLQLQILGADTNLEIDAAFERVGSERPDAVFVATTAFLNVRVVELAQLTAFHRLPSTHSSREYVEVGGLMSYGSNIADVYRQAGVYTGRVLKGAKPADMPVVQSSRFKLVINAHTARMLGITVPQSLLSRADEVIE
jgi:putative tryptophan/tyrosine transport system substrate-binding protein